MSPPIELLLLATLLALLRTARRALRYANRQKGSSASAAEASALSPMSAQTPMRGLDEGTGPTTMREVEEHVPTIDENGNRMTLIRTRTLRTLPGPAGPAEIEHSRRHTLPGHGHVSQLSDTEFNVFHGGVKLLLDVEAVRMPGRGGAARQRKPYEVSLASRLYGLPRHANKAHRGTVIHAAQLAPVGGART